MNILIQIGQLLLSLSILVILHELGHFVFARVFKTRVEKFYLFFDPWFSLFKFKKGDTEYGIGWLPLGGYVKISGMIDESMDKEQLKQPPQPHEFRSKPAWQRLLIMLGGVTVNLILGFIIYCFILFTWGEKYLPNKNLSDGIWVVDTLLYDAGLRNGDKIISINDRIPERFTDITEELLFGGRVLLERNGKDTTIVWPEDFAGQLADSRIHKKKGLLFYYRVPFIVSEIPEDSHNKNSGLKANDRIVAVGSIPLKYYDQYPSIVDTMKNRIVPFTIERGSKKMIIDLRINESGKIGVITGFLTPEQLEKLGYYQFISKKFTFFESIPAGFHKAKESLQSYIRQIGLIFNFNTGAHKGIGGFGAIGSLFPPVWDWQIFWEITAFLSIMLAFLNVLPIPALDGGHVMFLVYEMVTGRKPGDKFLEYAQIVGMALLLALLLYANGNDVYRWISGMIGK
jgi:regulator of sigma E protease